MEMVKLAYIVDDSPDFGTTARLIFKYNNFYFLAWKEEGEILSWIDDDILLLPYIGSFETRFPGVIRLAVNQDYKNHKDIVDYVENKIEENQEKLNDFFQKTKNFR